MSSGGQRGIDVSGITGLRLQNASDTTTRTRLQEIYLNFASTTGANAWRNQGRKEVGRRDICGADCSTCVGLPYQNNLVMKFRPA